MRVRNVKRRHVLQAGGSGLLGLGLPAVLGGRRCSADPGRAVRSQEGPTAESSQRTPRSVIIVFLTGAASHHDTFDMKPEAPAEIRGEFAPIATATPGLHVCEHLPQLAARSRKYAVIRTLSHGDNNHLMSTHHVLTGHKQPGGFFDKVASRDDWPCYSSASAFLHPRPNGLPSGVNLPTFLQQGPLTWPGQHAGLLGPKYDPWQITGDPNRDNFRVDSLTLAQGMNVSRLERRQMLLDAVNAQQYRMARIAETERLSDDQQSAFSILTSSGFARAFELQHEPESLRNRYGRHTTGQTLLLARRLIETGVPVVQANIGAVQTWDNHGNIFPTLKDRLLPPLDQGVSALLDDLEQRGLLDGTLVMMLGEFGRTPKINNNRGRDHWGPCFFGVFAGAGVQGGQVIGRSDDTGAYPVTAAYAPDDVGATVYQLLGISPEAEVRDRLDRPLRLNSGHPITPLFSGVAT